MVRKITAVRKQRPEIKRQPTKQMPQVVESIAMRTGLNEGEIRFVVYELRDAILDAHREGQAVKIEGLGTFTPTIHMDGGGERCFPPRARYVEAAQRPHEIPCQDPEQSNIGKSVDELAAQWNAEHPDDPIEG